jgi:two-component system, OmpR family, sensor kinase
MAAPRMTTLPLRMLRRVRRSIDDLRPIWSLRARLTLVFNGLFTFALIALGFGIHIAVSQSLYSGVERDLWAATMQVRSIYSAGGVQSIRTPSGELQLYLRGDFVQIFNTGNIGAQVFRTDGSELEGTPNLAGLMLELPDGALQLSSASVNTGLVVVRDINGERVESLVTPMVLQNGQIVGFLQVSRPLSDVDDTLTLLRQILLGGALIVQLVTGTAIALLARRALQPIERITSTAQGIVRAEDLGRRVPVPPQQDELFRLTVTVNDLLGRLDRLFKTQQRFVIDVSHELRTPLTAMQGNLELLARGAQQDPQLFAEILGDMRRETGRLIRMVNDLLVLAQSETQTQKIRNEAVELDTLLLEVYRELRPLAQNVTLRIGAEDQIQIRGDRDRIKQALLNLGVNALYYTPPGGLVTLGLEQRDGFAVLSVADTGVGIAEEERPHIFERFFRADRSRSRHSGGAGLGLSIVKWVAEVHGGHATVASALGRGSTFAIHLPLAAATAADAAPDGQAVPRPSARE